MTALRRLLCRIFGHPADQEYTYTAAGQAEPTQRWCGRCGETR